MVLVFNFFNLFDIMKVEDGIVVEVVELLDYCDIVVKEVLLLVFILLIVLLVIGGLIFLFVFKEEL